MVQILDFYIALFEHEFKKKSLQHDFPKIRVGGGKAVWKITRFVGVTLSPSYKCSFI